MSVLSSQANRRASFISGVVVSAVLLSACVSSVDDLNLARPVVSDAEYRLAKEAELRCILDHGWLAEMEPSSDGVTLEIGITLPPSSPGVPADDATIARAQRQADDCGRAHSWEVEVAYVQQHKLTGAAKEAALDSLHKCFVDVPVDGALRSDSSKQLLRRAAEQYPDPNSSKFQAAISCLNAHQWAITDQGESG